MHSWSQWCLTHTCWYSERPSLASDSRVDGGNPHEYSTKEVAVGSYCHRILLKLAWREGERAKGKREREIFHSGKYKDHYYLRGLTLRTVEDKPLLQQHINSLCTRRRQGTEYAPTLCISPASRLSCKLGTCRKQGVGNESNVAQDL